MRPGDVVVVRSTGPHAANRSDAAPNWDGYTQHQATQCANSRCICLSSTTSG
jgi:hypothetical protein